MTYRNLRPYWKKHIIQARIMAVFVVTLGTPFFLVGWFIDQIQNMEWDMLGRFYKECFDLIRGKIHE
jgi:hypothetical protein